MGIEPTSEAWEASILPMNYARKSAIELILYKCYYKRAINKMQMIFTENVRKNLRRFFYGQGRHKRSIGFS